MFHEYPLKFQGYLLSRSKMPAAKNAILIVMLKFGCSIILIRVRNECVRRRLARNIPTPTFPAISDSCKSGLSSSAATRSGARRVLQRSRTCRRIYCCCDPVGGALDPSYWRQRREHRLGLAHGVLPQPHASHHGRGMAAGSVGQLAQEPAPRNAGPRTARRLWRTHRILLLKRRSDR